MKRIPVVGLLSLGMLAVAPAKAYEGVRERVHEHERSRKHFMGDFDTGTSGARGTDTYDPHAGVQETMKPEGHRMDHQRFMKDFDERTSGSRTIFRGQKTRTPRKTYGLGKGHEFKETERHRRYHTNVRGMENM